MQKRFLKRDTVSFSVYMLLSLAFIGLSVRFPAPVSYARLVVAEVFAPVFATFKQPSAWVDSGMDVAAAYMAAGRQNEALRAENTELLQWKQKALMLADENNRLKTLLDVAKPFASNPLAVKILSDAKSPFARSVLVGAGADKGLKAGQEVLHNGGLVGRVVEVFPHTARVMLITDYTFRLPVKIMGVNVRGLARGTNGGALELMLVERDVSVAEGAMVLTSGAAGIVLPEIPVGVLSRRGGEMHIVPYANPSALDYVVVLRRPVEGVVSDVVSE